MASYSTREVILQYVFPSLGVVTGTFLTFAPYRAVVQASDDGQLGDLNPTPWAFLLSNAVGWCAYSFMTQNVFILASNFPAVILGIWLNIQAIKLQYENYRSKELRDTIVAALEEKKNARALKKKEITKIVDQAVEESDMDLPIIDPQTTAPILEVILENTTLPPHQQQLYVPKKEDNENDENGHVELAETDEEAQQQQQLQQQLMSSLSPTATASSATPTSLSEVDDDDDDLTEDGSHTGFDDDGYTHAETATGRILDYAAFIWQITAQKTPAPASHENIVLALAAIWLTLISFCAFPLWPKAWQILLIGCAVNCNLIFFYGAPLSRIAQVLQQQSNKTIHAPTMIATTLNGLWWFVYGLAVQDYFVSVPNGLGMTMGLLQTMLYWRFSESGKQQYAQTSNVWEACWKKTKHCCCCGSGGGRQREASIAKALLSSPKIHNPRGQLNETTPLL